jgi:hypothetical protein
MRRPNADGKKGAGVWREFSEYAQLREGQVMLTIEYSAGHLHARYEWAAAQVREAVATAFPAIRVMPKPIDTHAPKNRTRIGCFELQLVWLNGESDRLARSLLFSKLKGGCFPHLPRLLAKLKELQAREPSEPVGLPWLTRWVCGAGRRLLVAVPAHRAAGGRIAAEPALHGAGRAPVRAAGAGPAVGPHRRPGPGPGPGPGTAHGGGDWEDTGRWR